MKKTRISALLSIALTVTLAGCTHSISSITGERLVRIHGVVEEYDPEALVFYALDSIPYSATSHVARIRIEKPRSLHGRLIAIDLHEAKQKKDEEWAEFRIEGAVLTFSVPEKMIRDDDRTLIPVESVER